MVYRPMKWGQVVINCNWWIAGRNQCQFQALSLFICSLIRKFWKIGLKFVRPVGQVWATAVDYLWCTSFFVISFESFLNLSSSSWWSSELFSILFDSDLIPRREKRKFWWPYLFHCQRYVEFRISYQTIPHSRFNYDSLKFLRTLSERYALETVPLTKYSMTQVVANVIHIM